MRQRQVWHRFIFAAVAILFGALCGVPRTAAAQAVADGVTSASRATSVPATLTGETLYLNVLDNGLRLILAPNPDNRILAISGFLDFGASDELDAEAGITQLTQQLLLKGTPRRDAREIAERIEAVGGSLSVDTQQDYCRISTVTTIDEAELALELLADCLFRPTFPPEQFENERRLTLSRIRIAEDDPQQLAYKHFLKNLYVGHLYGRPILGSPETLAALKQPYLALHHRQCYLPNRLTLVAMGDFKPRRFEKLIQRRFGEFQPAPVNRMADSVILTQRFKRVELPRDVKQAFVCYGFTVCPARDKDFAALRVAAAVLGEGMSSRLFTRLRGEKGLVDQVGATLTPCRNIGRLMIFAGAKPEAIDDRFLVSSDELVALRVGVKAGIQAEIAALQSANVPAEELERAKNYIVGKFRLAHQTNAARVNHLGAFDQLGLGVNYDMLFPDLIRAVTARQVRFVARKYFTSPTIVTVRPQSENP